MHWDCSSAAYPHSQPTIELHCIAHSGCRHCFWTCSSFQLQFADTHPVVYRHNHSCITVTHALQDTCIVKQQQASQLNKITDSLGIPTSACSAQNYNNNGTLTETCTWVQSGSSLAVPSGLCGIATGDPRHDGISSIMTNESADTNSSCPE